MELVVNPSSGEVLEHLEQQPPEALAEALNAIHERQAEAKKWAEALEGELRRRLKARGAKLVVFGDWEVEASVRRSSVWDADELEPVLQRLVDEGALQAGDLTGVITRTPVVSASKANTVLRRLTGDGEAAVKACRTWTEKPGPLTVARSVQLAPADGIHPPALAPVPVPPIGRDGRPHLDPEELFK